MSVNPAIPDLSVRLSNAEKRIGRLETLEFGTTAFPAAKGLTLICDVLLAAPAPAIVLCPLPIPPAFAHLWVVIAAGTDVANPGKMRMTTNAPVTPPGTGGYEYYVRQEHPFGVPPGATDTQAVTASLPPDSDEAWKICHPAGLEPSGGLYTKQCACLVQIPNYANVTSAFVGDLGEANSHFGFAVTDIFDVGLASQDSIDQGGGGKRYSGLGASPVTSVHIATAFGETFLAGSQFTLYGL